jgi:hypothetical protein
MAELSYGQKAVGVSFNPSGDPKVDRIKTLYAEIIDLCHAARKEAALASHSEQVRLFNIAVTEAQGAQMWAVKALTFSE